MVLSRRCNAWVLLAVIVLSLAPSSWAAEFAGGTGAPNDPYQIATAEQLVSIGSDPNLFNKHFILTADIDLDPNLPGGRVFTQAVITADVLRTRYGKIVVEPASFDGSFDGNRHIVRNLVIDAVAGRDVGLFGIVGTCGRVQNLDVENARIEGASIAGALAAYNAGTVLRCHASGLVSGKSVGGLVGSNGWGEIAECCANVDVLGLEYACGGLVGTNGGTLTACFATGNILGAENAQEFGGLVGHNDHGRIKNCYARGNVSGGEGSQRLGGFVGHNTFPGYMINCYATGSVSGGKGSRDLGSFVGKSRVVDGGRGIDGIKTAVNACYVLFPVENGSLTNSIGLPLTDDQMKRQVNFIGWDFENIWTICEGRDYPRLRWEGAPCPP